MSSFLNPLELLRSQVSPQAPAVQSPTVQTPEPEPQGPAEEDENTLSSNFLRGWMERASNAGEMPKPEIFEERFKQSVSPGRELLANVLYGMSASLTGTKFRDVRARKFEEFQAGEQLKLQQQQAQTQQVKVVAEMQEIRQRLETQKELAQIKSIADKEKRLDAMSQFALRHNLNMDKFEEQTRVNTERIENAKRPRDKFYDFGEQQAKAVLAQQGKDPDAPSNEWELTQMTAAFANEQFQARERIKAITDKQFSRPPRPQRDRIVPQRITNGWGQVEIGSYNVDEGNFHKAPSHWDTGMPRDFTEGDVAKLEAAQNSINSLRTAAKIALANPNDTIGSFWKSVPPEWAAAMGNLPTDRRQVATHMKNALNERILGFSGAATNAREEVRITAGIPALFEKPETFVPGLLTYTAMIESQVTRQRAGIPADDLDTGGVVNTYLNALQGEIAKRRKEGKSLADIKIPTGDEFLQWAAEKKGVGLIRDGQGRIRGIKK